MKLEEISNLLWRIVEYFEEQSMLNKIEEKILEDSEDIVTRLIRGEKIQNETIKQED